MDIVTRKEAQERELARYFTGKPCPHGHVAERWASTSRCVECDRKYYEANREKIHERKSKYYEANREKLRERKGKYYEANREKLLESQRKYRQGGLVEKARAQPHIRSGRWTS